MSVWSAIKDFFTGKKSSTTKSSKATRSTSRRYGGDSGSATRGGSRGYSGGNGRARQNSVSAEDEEKRRRKELQRQMSARTDALASIGKDSNKQPKALTSAPKPKNGTERVLAKISEKATPPQTKTPTKPTTKSHRENRGSKTEEKVVKNARGDEVHVYSHKGSRGRALVGGTSASDMAYRMEVMPKSQSFARGAASGLSLGLTELEAKRLAKQNKDRAKAEKTYQQKKSKGAEMAGEAIGSLATFGGTAGGAEALASKVAPKATAKASARLAESKIIQNTAKRAANKAVEKGIAKEATEEFVKEIGKKKADNIVKALGTDVVQNLTTGAMYDVNKASAEYEVGSKDWWKELGKSAAFNAAITGGVAGVSSFVGGRGVVGEALDTLSSRARARNAVFDRAEEANRVINPKAERVNLREEFDIANKPTPKNEVFDRAAQAEDALDRQVVLGDAYGNIREGALPKNEVNPRDLPRRTVPIRNIENADRIEPDTYSRLIRNAEESAPSDARSRLDDLINMPDRRGARANARLNEINDELDRVSDEIASARRMAEPEREDELIQRFDDLMAERNALEYGQTSGRTADNFARNADEAVETPSALAEATEGNADAVVPPRPENVETDVKAEAPQPRSISRKAEPPTAKANDNGTYQMLDEEMPMDSVGRSSADDADFAQYAAKQDEKVKDIDNVNELVGAKREKKSIRETIASAAESFNRRINDSLTTFEKEARKKHKTDHEGMLKDYGATDRFRRHNAIAGRSVRDGQLNWHGDVFRGTVNVNGREVENGKSLMQIFDGMDEATEKDFDSYLLLMHAPDRMRWGRPIFDKRSLNGRSLNDPEVCLEEARKILAKHPEFETKADEIYLYTRNELQNRVDAGLLPQETVDEWIEKYPHYVPTARVGEFTDDHDIWDVAGQLANSRRTVGAGDIKSAKGSDLAIRSIKEQLADATSRNWRDMTMNNLFRRMFGDKIAENLAKEADGGVEKVLDNTLNLGKSKGGKYYAEVFENGKAKRVEIDKKFYDDIEDLFKNGRLGNGLEAFDAVNDAASKFSNVFKNLITSWSPIFLVKNFMRDFPEAIINSRQTKEFLESMSPAMKDLVEGGKWSEALRNSGVSQANFVNLDEALFKNTKNPLKKFANKFATLNELTEMYPRLVEYMATLKKAGIDLDTSNLKDIDRELLDMAAANAADVTVNFGRSGSIGKAINRGLVPFFNPSIQGWSKFIRNVSEQEGVKPLLGMLAKATALGAAPTVINNFLLEDNPNYQMISARDKANNYIIPIPPTDDNASMFIKIPRSRFASVYGLPAVNIANDNKMGFAEAIRIVGDQIVPIDPLESNLLAPLAAVANNKTWYGSPIVSGALEDLPPSEQYDPNTSLIGKALGKATENLPKNLQISPKKADYLIDATTGVAGDFILPALTPSRQSGGDNPIANAGYAMGNVVKRQFSIDPVTQNDLSTRFYDRLQNAETDSKSMRSGEKESDEYKRMNAYSTEISDISEAIRHLQAGKSATKQADIYGLQKVRNQMMQDALDGKGVPSAYKTMDAVQKYVGTTYAISNFGSSADQEAMKAYGVAKYGNLTEKAMQKRIDADKDFYKGVQAIGKLDARIRKEGITSNTALSKAVALADSGANDEVFGAYGCTKQSRTESANKMDRARTYFNDGGSTDEFAKLEKARRTGGKLSDTDQDAELEKLEKQLGRGEISQAEYKKKVDDVKYNANISYVGLATSLAQANAPARGYELYDIKAKNVQKGINLAAMGFDARDYREMMKELDTDGNGYPKTAEIRAYVANSDVEDKATLYDCLYYYQGKYNPFGTPTNYSREQAAANGKAKGIEAISDGKEAIKIKNKGKESSSSSGYSRHRRYGGHRRYSRRGGGSSAKAKVPTPKKIAASSLKKGTALVGKSRSSSFKSTAPTLKRVEAKIDLPTAKR